jgi:hypothetical protein
MKRSMLLIIATTMWARSRRGAEAAVRSFDRHLQAVFEYNKDNMSLMLMWLDGYYSEDDAPPIVDFDKMMENSKKLGEYCGKNPATA